MKEVIRFCESNNYNYKIETLRNGVKRATVKAESYPLEKEIYFKAKSENFYVETSDFDEIKVFIYDEKGRREIQKRRFKLVTVAEMQVVTSRLMELGFSEYSVLSKVPFRADALMYSSWDAYAFESSAISSNSIYLDLAEYSNQVMLPDNLLELAEKINPNQNCKNGRGLNVKTFDKVLLDLISEGLADYYIFRTSFEDKDDKYETFSLGEFVEHTKEYVYFSLEKV